MSATGEKQHMFTEQKPKQGNVLQVKQLLVLCLHDDTAGSGYLTQMVLQQLR